MVTSISMNAIYENVNRASVIWLNSRSVVAVDFFSVIVLYLSSFIFIQVGTQPVEARGHSVTKNHRTSSVLQVLENASLVSITYPISYCHFVRISFI